MVLLGMLYRTAMYRSSMAMAFMCLAVFGQGMECTLGTGGMGKLLLLFFLAVTYSFCGRCFVSVFRPMMRGAVLYGVTTFPYILYFNTVANFFDQLGGGHCTQGCSQCHKGDGCNYTFHGISYLDMFS